MDPFSRSILAAGLVLGGSHLAYDFGALPEPQTRTQVAALIMLALLVSAAVVKLINRGE